MLAEGLTYGINGSFGSPEKKFSINFTKAITKFCLSLHYNADDSYLFVNGKEIFKFKGCVHYILASFFFKCKREH